MGSSRAHTAIERSVLGQTSQAQVLVQTLDELRNRSAPERLPQVQAALGDSCHQLQTVLVSPAFRLCVGDAFPKDLPMLTAGDTNSASAMGMLCDAANRIAEEEELDEDLYSRRAEDEDSYA